MATRTSSRSRVGASTKPKAASASSKERDFAVSIHGPKGSGSWPKIRAKSPKEALMIATLKKFGGKGPTVPKGTDAMVVDVNKKGAKVKTYYEW